MTLLQACIAFLVGGAVVAVVGVRIVCVSKELALSSGLGEATFGALLLGASTSISGIFASLSAAYLNRPELAFSNAMGGIAAQTAFLSVADMFYRRANLEHAAASVTNLMNAALLLFLLAFVLMVMTSPPISVMGVHPGSAMIFVFFAAGFRIIRSQERDGGWYALQTDETVLEETDELEARARRTSQAQRRHGQNWLSFLTYAFLLSVAGWLVAKSGTVIVDKTALSESFVGALLLAIVTSVPELVTSVAAVRHGALTLAIGNIIGGNSFEVILLPLADIAYRSGSLYHALGSRQVFVLSLAAALNAVLLLGLLRREKHGIGGIGFESALVAIMYLAGVAVLAFS